MGSRRTLALALAVVAGVALVAMPAAAQETAAEGETTALRIGWAQDPQTLNPFVGLDEEDYNVWAINWELLVGFSPEDLSPAPAIAESWEVSEDRKTVTFKLHPDALWSDGEPITSADVKWSLETLGEEGSLFTNYTSNVTAIRTPDPETVVIETRRPDARIVGGLFVYILPEHVWGKVPLEELTGSYKPELPLVGSGPYVVTEFERNRIIRMERNPNFRGEEPAFDEVQYIKYGTQDAVERALQLGEIDMIVEVQESTFERLSSEPNIEVVQSPSPSYTELAFNLCPRRLCPDAEFNPAIQDVEVRRAIAHAIDRERINEIAALGTAFVANGVLPSYYKDFYEPPEETYPYDPELANQILDEAGYTERTDDDVRTNGSDELSFDLLVRSESQYNIRAARLVAEQAEAVGIEFNVQVVSVDKLTEVTIRKVDGKPAPEFDTFIWGWGGDPYDPSFILSLFLTKEIGGLSDSFFSDPEYDRLFAEQAGIFDAEERKEIIREMVAITQREVAYVVLTEDPNLQAYRTDTIDNVEILCPRETGDIICEQVSYEPLLSIAPAEGGGGDDSGGQSPGLAIVAALVFGIGGWLLGARQSRRREREPLELPE